MWILTDYPVAMIVLFGSTLRSYRDRARRWVGVPVKGFGVEFV